MFSYSFISMPFNSEVTNTAKHNFQSYILSVDKDIPEDERFYNYPETLFFFDFVTKKIYQYPTSTNPSPITPDSLFTYATSILKNESFDPNALYQLLYDFLRSYAKHNIYGYSYVKYMNEIYSPTMHPTFFHNPSEHFIMKDGCLCHSSAIMPLPIITETYFDYLLAINNLPPMPINLKKKIVATLRNGYIKNYKSLNNTSILFDLSGKQLEYEYNQMTDEHNYITVQKNYPTVVRHSLPAIFIKDNYQFDTPIIDFLQVLIGDNLKYFNYFSKMIASAFLNGNPLKKATIFVVDKNSANHLINFLYLLFLNEMKILNRNCYHDIAGNYASFFPYAYQKLFIINDNVLPLHFEDINGIVKSNYFTYTDNIVGKVKFKTKTPLVVITDNKDYAYRFKMQVNSNVIIPESSLPPINDSSKKSIDHLRQALALYGLRLFNKSKEETNTAVIHKVPDDYIVSKFIENYCIPDNGSLVTKTELRSKFREYLDTFYPYSTQSDIAVCHELRKRGFSDRNKKRILGYENPVYVVENIAFLKNKFDKNIKQYSVPQEKAPEKSGFEKILSILYESKITL